MILKNNKVLAVIGARGGSKRLERKNLQKIGSKTLIEITIEQALHSKLINKIVFSSEDDEMINNAKPYPIDIHKRSLSLSADNIGILKVVQQVIKDYLDYDVIVILQVDAPFKSSQMIDECVNLFKHNKVEDLITHRNNKRTGSIRVMSRKGLLSSMPTSHIYLVGDSSNFIDIHTKEDLDKANEIIPSCLLCGSNQIERFLKDEQLWKCNGCGIVFQYPQGNYDYLNYANTRIEGRDKRIEQYKLDIKEILRFKGKGKFLDVGCGEGTFLSYLPSSFDKDGIDVRGNYKIGDFATYNFKENYDIIHMRGTLEHLKQPEIYIKRAFDILNSNGLLVISHLPNIDNYPYMKGLIKKDEHLFYFTPTSIAKLIEHNGFSVSDIIFPFFRSPYEKDEGARFMNILTIFGKKNES